MSRKIFNRKIKKSIISTPVANVNESQNNNYQQNPNDFYNQEYSNNTYGYDYGDEIYYDQYGDYQQSYWPQEQSQYPQSDLTPPWPQVQPEPKQPSWNPPKPEQQVKLDIKNQPQIEPKIQTKLEPKIQTKLEPKIQTKLEPKPQVMVEPKREYITPIQTQQEMPVFENTQQPQQPQQSQQSQQSQQYIEENLNSNATHSNTRDMNMYSGYNPSPITQKFVNGRIFIENKEKMPGYFNTEYNGFDNKQNDFTDFNSKSYRSYDDGKLLYRINNLGVSTSRMNKDYPGMVLRNLNFDIYSGDRIAIVSDKKLYDKLLIDLLKSNIKRSEGKIFSIKNKNPVWNDVNDEQIEESRKEVGINSLGDINYNSIINFKNTLDVILNKLIIAFSPEVNEETLTNFLNKFFLEDVRSMSLNILSLACKNRFLLLCDILVKKRVVYADYMGLDLNLKDKFKFYRFVCDYFNHRDVVFILSTDDITELKIMCNKIIIIADQTKIDEKYFKDILKYYESIDDYIVLKFQ